MHKGLLSGNEDLVTLDLFGYLFAPQREICFKVA